MEISFEELELDPLRVLKQIYTDLDISWADAFETAVHEFLWVNKGFEKKTLN